MPQRSRRGAALPQRQWRIVQQLRVESLLKPPRRLRLREVALRWHCRAWSTWPTRLGCAASVRRPRVSEVWRGWHRWATMVRCRSVWRAPVRSRTQVQPRLGRAGLMLQVEPTPALQLALATQLPALASLLQVLVLQRTDANRHSSGLRLTVKFLNLGKMSRHKTTLLATTRPRCPCAAPPTRVE